MERDRKEVGAGAGLMMRESFLEEVMSEQDFAGRAGQSKEGECLHLRVVWTVSAEAAKDADVSPGGRGAMRRNADLSSQRWGASDGNVTERSPGLLGRCGLERRQDQRQLQHHVSIS